MSIYIFNVLELIRSLALNHQISISIYNRQMYIQPPSIAPYQGCSGRWVLEKHFRGSKSFGYFVCDNCQTNWLSAHAMKGFKQGCKNCEEQFSPAFMWLNDSNYENEGRRGANMDTQKPHRSDLCQACRMNMCVQRNNFGRSYRSKRNNFDWWQ